MEHMSEYQKGFQYIHSTKYSYHALYNIFNLLPLSASRSMLRLVQDHKVQLQSDVLHLPKLTPNSVPVFQCNSQNALRIRDIRAMPLLTIPLLVLIPSQYFLFPLLFSLSYLALYQKSFRRLNSYVVRLQLIPETEELVYQKVDAMGRLITERVHISDVEYEDFPGEVSFKAAWKSVIDFNMVFKVKPTGELLMFDKNGIWHQEGIEHQLLK